MKCLNLFSGKKKKKKKFNMSSENFTQNAKGEMLGIALGKKLFVSQKIFFLFLHKNVCCGTHWNCFA